MKGGESPFCYFRRWHQSEKEFTFSKHKGRVFHIE
jgi:hypothetical protein